MEINKRTNNLGKEIEKKLIGDVQYFKIITEKKSLCLIKKKY